MGKEQAAPMFLAPSTSFMGVIFFHRQGGRSVQPRSLACAAYNRIHAPMRI